MNHGLVALEPGDNPGAAVWDWTATREELVVYAEASLVFNTAGLPDGLWSKNHVRAAGGVKVFPDREDYTVQYGRYHPRHKREFVRMCTRCLGDPSWPSLVAPEGVSDDEAKELLESFYALSARLLMRCISNRPVARVVQRVRVGIPWAYLVGFFGEASFTVFVSEDATAVSDFQRHAINYVADYRLQERW